MGTLRGLITLALVIAFGALVVWLFFVRQRKDFDDAAHIPLRDESASPDADQGERHE